MPVSRNTLRCCEIAGWVTPGNAATNAPAGSSPPSSMSIICRRVGSAIAANRSISADLYAWPAAARGRPITLGQCCGNLLQQLGDRTQRLVPGFQRKDARLRIGMAFGNLDNADFRALVIERLEGDDEGAVVGRIAALVMPEFDQLPILLETRDRAGNYMNGLDIVGIDRLEPETPALERLKLHGLGLPLLQQRGIGPGRKELFSRRIDGAGEGDGVFASIAHEIILAFPAYRATAPSTVRRAAGTRRSGIRTKIGSA